MPVYVDDMEASFGRMIMCHMVADTTEELLATADKIGVRRRWIQNPGTPHEHFDIALSKRKLAISHGAIQVTWRELAAMSARKEATGALGDPGDAVEWMKLQYRKDQE